MTLPDLPSAQNEYQATLFAKAYADSIKAYSRLMELKRKRIQAQEESAPEWFLRMVDIDIDYILLRLEQLERWGSDDDPKAIASNTEQRIRIVFDMVSNFLKPSRMLWGSVKRTEAWLAEGEKEGAQ
ncbi:hypothetical protein [Proteus mirabilis]|uniref:hypothetical protein n=1 Tax=Proteus mirabilis TaxID=584 RepID=UPI002876E3EB|nr:hypothetical protein [Proteus mirabilis]MDS0822350.1 hypothetical protein [Proteus mirabilis]HEK2097730.1 hypothetical protein [Proteus mirabilis]